MDRESIVTLLYSAEPFTLSQSLFSSLYDPGWLCHSMTAFSSLDSDLHGTGSHIPAHQFLVDYAQPIDFILFGDSFLPFFHSSHSLVPSHPLDSTLLPCIID